MNDFESKGAQNLRSSPSTDYLSLEKWAWPLEEPKKTFVKSIDTGTESKSMDTVMESRSIVTGIESLIPEFIRSICRDPKWAELRVAFDAPTEQCTYNYSIVWDEVEVKTDEFYRKALKKNNFASIRQDGHPVPVTTRCDGPCKKEFPSNKLSTIGKCGHYLCPACYGIVKNGKDGTIGCSSFQCFWKGKSREETKKNYEKDVRCVQREKATELSAQGMDVKAASAASSESNLSSMSPSTTPPAYLTLALSRGNATIIPSISSPAIKTKFIIVETSEKHGMTHVYYHSKLSPTTKLQTALETMLIRKNKKIEDYIPRGNVYYGLMADPHTLGMRQIQKSSFKKLEVKDIPRLSDRLVLIMDMGDYVAQGKQIYLE